jgi:Protein of unknown function (DUF1501)
MSTDDCTGPCDSGRRAFLTNTACGFGWLALSGILGESAGLGRGPSASIGRQDPNDPLAPKPPHFAARAKRVIFMNMAGAPSHVDTFDPKPRLEVDHGKAAGGKLRGTWMASPFKFTPSGRSGLPISELFPNVARHADHLCMLHGMYTDLPAHPQASVKLHTGNFQFVRPSMGAWLSYGLGTSNRNLPSFVTLSPDRGNGGAQNYGAAFLPAIHQGTPINIGRTGRVAARSAEEGVANLKSGRFDREEQREQIDFLQALNRERLRREKDAQVEGVIESFELAYRMQAEIPDLLDLSKEPKETLALYGIGEQDTEAFGRQCLAARRLAQAGVRFIQVTKGGWDHHRNLRQSLTDSCRSVDKPIAGLLEDLARTGLLKDTLVLWGGEFGRTPYAQGNDGRDHNNKGFTMWMAGGGVKGGFAYGSTDEHGYEAVAGRISIHDWHATILHIMGLDHTRLTYPHAGREFRLTDVHGEIVKDILA